MSTLHDAPAQVEVETEVAELELVVPPVVAAAERSGASELALYLAAGAAYVTIGVFVTEILRSWIVGFGFLILCVWGLPALAGRVRR